MTHDDFLQFVPYCQQRLDDDPHLQANVLYGEIVELGYDRAYSTFTRALRRHLTRPRCGSCHRGRASPGCGTVEDLRFDWVRLPPPPVEWDSGREVHLLMGSLTRSGRWRAALADTDDLPHYVAALDQVLRRLGGTGERWLFDRTRPVCSTAGKVTAVFHQIAVHYGASIAIRPQMEAPGPVVRAHRSVVLHWWNTAAEEPSVQAAQDSLDRLAERSDRWHRRTGCSAQALLPLPPKPFPARICVQRRVDPHGRVSFEGNFYLLPGLAGNEVGIRRRLDEPHLSVTTTRGAVIARFPRAPRGAGQTVAEHSGPITLERPNRTSGAGARALAAGRTRRPRCRAATDEDQAPSRRDDQQPTKPLARATESRDGSASPARSRFRHRASAPEAAD
ncbi:MULTISPECIES: Mu transposase domain-containing protein [Kitasatospora]|uniref:IS21 family transposase n=1 Tax=Kitasatospora cathayae TaxID=3004092 RepID=A0ABY7QGY6_9ACTN|nr:IS21 family transposase [Kitasatospora sp. HUAS 3-15]WBP92070.1 IS21 family transposase [Kitasatospora sp. HUAS 3-15]